MEITQVTTIKLEDAEKCALQTLRGAYIQCVYDDCFNCEICPLYVNKVCIGNYAEMALDRQKGECKE